MSVLIKGMDMPEKCSRCNIEDDWYYCPLANGDNGDTAELRYDERLINCPLVEIPEKHGRLIDADELIEFIENRYDITWKSDCYEGGIKDACTDIIEKINSMPTIIEAEGGK